MMEHDERKKTNKVNLVSASTGSRVILEASPTVSENRTVNYQSLEPLHAPGQIQVYKNTASRTFTISDIKIISRTTEEANRNLKKLWLLRSWCMPRFGNSSTLDEDEVKTRQKYPEGDADFSEFESEGFESEEEYRRDQLGTELLGAPPEVLYLSAYSQPISSDASQNASRPGTEVWNRVQHINRVPVVINGLTIPYPNDVDYINTVKGVPMPIIMNIDISLVETHSPNAYENFNLDDFRSGILKGF